MTLKEQIENYVPYDEQEERDKEQMLSFIDKFDDVLTRKNIFGHFTASAFIINKERNKMVAVYHLINNSWQLPGGHVDGEEDLLKVALREVEEETGLKPKVLNNKKIFTIQSAPIKGHIKHGKYVSAHLHLDAVFLMEADESIPLIYREDESKGIKWLSFEEATSDIISDFVRPIHKKIIERLKKEDIK